MIQAVILAGGLGTRLSGLLNGLPKPMAPVRGKPFLEYQLLSLRRHAIDRVVICVGYRGQTIRDYFGNGSRWGMQIGYSAESTPLGTAGALRHAEFMLDSEFLVLNGDTYVAFDYSQLIHYHREERSETTLAVRALDDPEPYGNVALNPDNRITCFGEEQVPSMGPQPALINAGVYVMERSILSHIPPGHPASLEKDTFPLLAAHGMSIYGFIVSGYFVDIGTPANYLRFERDLAEGRVHVVQE